MLTWTDNIGTFARAHLGMAEAEAGDGLTRTLKDLTSGAAGGIAQVLLGEFCSKLFTLARDIL